MQQNVQYDLLYIATILQVIANKLYQEIIDKELISQQFIHNLLNNILDYKFM